MALGETALAFARSQNRRTRVGPSLSVDEVLLRTDASGTHAVLSDSIGSTVALANTATGAVETQYTYEPFGNASAAGPSSSNPYRFTGREDDGTGLLYYRARYYSPRLQRFLKRRSHRLQRKRESLCLRFRRSNQRHRPFGLIGLALC